MDVDTIFKKTTNDEYFKEDKNMSHGGSLFIISDD
jgi:hypothetical protein